ncbi:MAG: hypothetical protein FWH01_05950 [Oscillospiraceae bacterium]|nr:hypothetical protein [Oscillospiraceae bacterium]
MYKKEISFLDFEARGAKIIKQTATSLVMEIPKGGGGAVLKGPAGKVGGADWAAAKWLYFDVYNPNKDVFATVVEIGFWRDGMDVDADDPRFVDGVGIYPNYMTRTSVGFSELAAQNVFLPQTPGGLKAVMTGRAVVPTEAVALFLGGRECHETQVFEFYNLTLSEEEPDYPMPDLKLMDKLGQWTQKDWEGKTRRVEDLVDYLRSEYDKPLVANPKLSKWGGWLDKKFDATGYFRTQHDGKRWWLVDPDGYVFISAGMDCIQARESSRVTDWEGAYEWLPVRHGKYNAAYAVSSGDPTRGRRVRYSELVSFSIINLIRAFGENWYEAWCKITRRRLAEWGINTLGNGAEPEFVKYSKMPWCFFMRGFPRTDVTIYRDFPDVYSPQYAERAEVFAQQLVPYLDDRYMLGYYLTNEPEWGFGHDIEISEHMLEIPVESDCKNVFIKKMADKYRSIDAFNKAWNLSLSGFDDLKKSIRDARKLSEAAAADLSDFSREIITLFAKIPSEATKKVDPNHLNMGMRYAYIGFENQVAGHEYFDIFDINNYSFDCREYLDWIGGLVEQPILISEFHHGALDKGVPCTGIRGVRTQAERGQAYRHYVEQALRSNYLVGAHYFILNDHPAICTSYQENYNIGFVDICNRPYGEFTDQVAQTNEQIYAVANHDIAAYDNPPDGIPMNTV